MIQWFHLNKRGKNKMKYHIIWAMILAMLFSVSVNAGIAGISDDVPPGIYRLLIDIDKQRMYVEFDRVIINDFPVSTGKGGTSDRHGSHGTPTGVFQIKQKVGAGAEILTRFKGLRPVGKAKLNQPGDAITTRVMTLKDAPGNSSNVVPRRIYIHGTSDELNIGKPVSMGCIRMLNKDVVWLFDRVKVGTTMIYIQQSVIVKGVG
jgi:lipoprotein-anchoring transpeptidase ErfK/SrfK